MHIFSSSRVIPLISVAAVVLCCLSLTPAHALHPVTEPGNYEDMEAEDTASEQDLHNRLSSRLFAPLIADPRWPHFYIAYHYYTGDDELRNVGATSFGETMPFLEGDGPWGSQWELGIQAAVFAVFDLDAASKDLVNADYWVGLPFSFRRDRLSGIVRLFHQSSHIGDEYLLRNRVDRVNLSYESVDMKLSYDVQSWFRVYGGSGYLIRKEPEDLKRWSVQAGLELKSPRTYLNGTVQPLAGIDLKSREEVDWKIDTSVRSGVQFFLKRKRIFLHRMQLMLEYFNGYSPHGQFFERQIEYIALGTHFYF